MAAHDLDELRIALRRPDRGAVADRPEAERRRSQSRRPRPIAAASVPLTIAIARGAPPSRIGSVSARCTGTKKPGTSSALLKPLHQISAPPEKEKKDRKKELAAKAIDRPKTIWISRRKPPDVSPKASVRPVTVMMMTGDDLGDRALDRLQNLIERLSPTAWTSRRHRAGR